TRFSRDWSSDVCSSDLVWESRLILPLSGQDPALGPAPLGQELVSAVSNGPMCPWRPPAAARQVIRTGNVRSDATGSEKLSAEARSEERRVGKEWRARSA